MNIYTGLLFNQGYIHDPKLAAELAGSGPASPNSAPACEPLQPDEKAARPKPGNGVDRRRSISVWCSTALSPFR